MSKRVVALAGGVGAARFLEGLAQVVDPARIVIVGNTADDTEMYGLHISPDLDTVAYTLAGMSNPRHGWGVKGDSFHCLDALKGLGAEAWFQLGDRDFASHLYRTARLAEGAGLAKVTSELARAWGLRSKLLPMTEDRVRTLVKTRRGTLDFQTYFVRRQARDTVLGISFEGAKRARPAPAVLTAIRQAAAVILCPSNPIISIGPILAVPGIRQALRDTRAPVAAISPIVGGRALKGPAARMMKSLGLRVSASGVAELYRDFADIFVLDRVDSAQAAAVEALGMRAVVTDTIMTSAARKRALARAVIAALLVGEAARKMIFALLPVKAPGNAKQRLSGLLTPVRREQLARLMFEHALETLCAARGLDRVVVVTSDQTAAHKARLSGALVFEEEEQRGHSHSADQAARRAMGLGAVTVLLAPIDVPLVTTAEIEDLAARARRGVVIVPDSEGTGTNALVRTPPDVIESRFGPGSFEAHLEQARSRGVPAEVARPAGLMFDIDTPEDVAELLIRAPDCRVARFLCPSAS